MKFLTALLLVAMLVAILVTPGRSGRGGGRGGGMGSASSACRTTYPNTADALNTFRSTGQATQDLKCFMSCVMQEKGLMESNGTIARKELMGRGKTLPESFKTATEPCFQMTPTSDLCETAYLHNKCMWDNDSEKMFIRLFE